MNRRKPRWMKAIGVALGAAALAAAAIWAWHIRRPELQAERLRSMLAADSDQQAEQRLREIAELDEAGVPTLVALLASDRVILRDGSRALILEAIEHWELLTPEAAAPKLAGLARALAKNAPQFEARDRRFAADLATRLIDWPSGAGSPNRDQLLADCETVLSALRLADAAPARNGADADSGAAKSNATNEPINLSLPALARLPGGGLPVEMEPLPKKIAQANIRKPAAPVAPSEPNRLPDEIASRSLRDANQAPRANEPRRLPDGDDSDSPTSRLSHSQVDKSSALLAGDWQRMELRGVLRELRSTDPDSVAKAEAELHRRGVTGPLMDLARRAADPDPQVRRELAEALPDLPGVDARPWLLEMSYDEDPKVRAAAVTLMATSGDLELLRRVRQVSLDDPDDYTRSQAQKALPRQRR